MKLVSVIIWPIVAGLFLGIGIGVWQNYQDNRPSHTTYFINQTDYFDVAYQAAAPIQPAPKPVLGVVVNHHLLAAALIARVFNQVATNQPTTVIILSPNHFDAGTGKFITAEWCWRGPYGTVRADVSLIQQLNQAGLVTVDEQPFNNEHGVGNLVPFIKHSLPQAKIVPIIFRDNLTAAEVTSWVTKIMPLLPKDSLIVASLDMSHYTAEPIAVKQDANTLVAIQTLDSEAAWQQKIDSPAVLSAWLQLMKSREATQFTLLDRSSSTLLSGAVPEDNTSYITGFFY